MHTTLDRLTLVSFAGHLNSVFRVTLVDDEPVDLEMIRADALPSRSALGSSVREPFSLLFRGPRQRPLPQLIHHLGHPLMGELEIFLVPLGPEGDPTGTHYQAVFN